MGFRFPHNKGEFLGSGIVKYRDFLLWAVQKQLQRWICRLCCGLGWAEGSTNSIVFVRWHQCTRRHSTLSCAKTAELIDLPFGLLTRVCQRKHEFNRVRQVALMCPHGRAHWHHLANTTESTICGGDMVLCQITLTTCYLMICKSSFLVKRWKISIKVGWDLIEFSSKMKCTLL